MQVTFVSRHSRSVSAPQAQFYYIIRAQLTSCKPGQVYHDLPTRLGLSARKSAGLPRPFATTSGGGAVAGEKLDFSPAIASVPDTNSQHDRDQLPPGSTTDSPSVRVFVLARQLVGHHDNAAAAVAALILAPLAAMECPTGESFVWIAGIAGGGGAGVVRALRLHGRCQSNCTPCAEGEILPRSPAHQQANDINPEINPRRPAPPTAG